MAIGQCFWGSEFSALCKNAGILGKTLFQACWLLPVPLPIHFLSCHFLSLLESVSLQPFFLLASLLSFSQSWGILVLHTLLTLSVVSSGINLSLFFEGSCCLLKELHPWAASFQIGLDHISAIFPSAYADKPLSAQETEWRPPLWCQFIWQWQIPSCLVAHHSLCGTVLQWMNYLVILRIVHAYSVVTCLCLLLNDKGFMRPSSLAVATAPSHTLCIFVIAVHTVVNSSMCLSCLHVSETSLVTSSNNLNFHGSLMLGCFLF